YQPDNAVLVVAGQFDEAKALQYIRKYFGLIPRPARKLDTTYTDEPPQDGERLVTLRRVGELGLVGAVYHIPAGPHPDFAALQVLEHVLKAEPSGRLYEALVKSKKAAAVNASAFALHDPGVLVLLAQVNRGTTLEEVRDTLLDVVEKAGAKGVTQEEVERARRKILTQREQAAANTTQVAIQLSAWAAQGDWRLYFLHRDRIEKVTADDVKNVALKYLQRNNRTVGLYVPTEKAERVAMPATPNVKELVSNYKGRDTIALGEAFAVSPENIEARIRRETLPGGVKRALLPKKTRGETVTIQQ